MFPNFDVNLLYISRCSFSSFSSSSFPWKILFSYYGITKTWHLNNLIYACAISTSGKIWGEKFSKKEIDHKFWWVVFSFSTVFYHDYAPITIHSRCTHFTSVSSSRLLVTPLIFYQLFQRWNLTLTNPKVRSPYTL